MTNEKTPEEIANEIRSKPAVPCLEPARFDHELRAYVHLLSVVSSKELKTRLQQFRRETMANSYQSALLFECARRLGGEKAVPEFKTEEAKKSFAELWKRLGYDGVKLPIVESIKKG